MIVIIAAFVRYTYTTSFYCGLNILISRNMSCEFNYSHITDIKAIIRITNVCLLFEFFGRWLLVNWRVRNYLFVPFHAAFRGKENCGGLCLYMHGYCKEGVSVTQGLGVVNHEGLRHRTKRVVHWQKEPVKWMQAVAFSSSFSFSSSSSSPLLCVLLQ